MKKWGILVLVLMGAGLLYMQYFMKKSDKPALTTMQQTPLVQEPAGVSLPAAATAQYVAPMAAVSYIAGAGDYNDLQLPKVPTNYTGACQGGSLEDIRLSHGKYWGYFAKNNPVTGEETKKIYDYMSSYVGCVAAAHDNIGLCLALPDEAQVGDTKIDSVGSLSNACRGKTNPLLFTNFMAGKAKSSGSCYSMVSGWPKKGLAKISVPDFCEAVSKGMESGKAYMLKVNPKKAETFRKLFPISKASCGGDADCMDNLALYNAVKDEKAAECPRSKKVYCEAMVAKSAIPCEEIVRDMSRFYCDAVARTRKKSGGFIGMSKEEVKAEIEKVEAAKKLAAQQRKAMDKITEDVNKSAKKILKKE
jgi:hypothetical protein